MPCEIDCLEDEKIIVLKYTGECTFDDYVQQTRKAVELSRIKNVTLFLSDCRLLENKADLSEIYQLPKLYDELGTSRGNKLVLLITKESPILEDAHFFENICQTRGHNVKVFTSYDEAIEWLKE